MKYLFLIGVLFSGSFALANRESGGVGSLEQLNCQGRLADGTAVKFEIRGTAVPTFAKGRLQVADANGTSMQLRCTLGSDVVEGVPTAGSVEWLCSEYQHIDDGDISIELVRGGVTGILTGTIKQKQMFPLPPKPIGKLVCR